MPRQGQAAEPERPRTDLGQAGLGQGVPAPVVPAPAPARPRLSRAPSRPTSSRTARPRAAARPRLPSRPPQCASRAATSMPGPGEALLVRRVTVAAHQPLVPPGEQVGDLDHVLPRPGPARPRSPGPAGDRPGPARCARPGRCWSRRSAPRTGELTFSPASNGRVHILEIASRAEFACKVHIPGRPLLSAISRSRLSAWRTSPTISRFGRIRSASFTSRRNGTSPCPLQARLAALHRRPSRGCAPELEDLLAGDDPLARRDRRGQAVQQRGLAGLGAAGDQHVQPGGHRRGQERGRVRGQGAERDEILQPGRPDGELPDVHGQVVAG